MSASNWTDWEPPDRSDSGKIIPPKLVPLFPVLGFTPLDSCPHFGRIRRGSVFVCMVCHQSGMDHLDLPGWIDGEAKADETPPPRRAKPSRMPRAKAPKQTRKQRRAALYADPAV